MIRPAPRPEAAPPSLSIPRLESAPSLDDFLTMQPQGAAALQMAKVTGFSQRNPHDGDHRREFLETEARETCRQMTSST